MEPTDKSRRFDLADDRTVTVAALVRQIVNSSCDFQLFPPREVTSDPAILQSKEIVDRLADSKWWLRLDDGTEELLTLPELVALIYNLLAVKGQIDETKRQKKKTTGINIPVMLDVTKLMQPDTVCMLLAKVDLEGLPSSGK